MRTLWFMVKVAAVIAVAVWLANQPGHVTIDWRGYRADMAVGVLAGAVLVAAAAAAALYRFWRGLRHLPAAFVHGRRARRREQGYRALTQGMVAVAAGDPDAARRYARRADVLLNEPPLTLLLSAQAAQLGGDEDAATRYFTAMLDRRETEFLGIRGLLTQALKRGDNEEALRLARRGRAVQSSSGWLLGTLVDLEARAGNWAEAEAALVGARRAGSMDDAVVRNRRAVVMVARSAAAEEEGDTDRALSLARSAAGLRGDFAPIVVRAARLLRAAGKERDANKAIEAAWRSRPHPDLASCYVNGAMTPLGALKRVERLAAFNPTHVETHVALGRAALTARLWGEARHHLALALELEHSRRVADLLAELAASSGEAVATPRAGEDLLPDAVWLCGECGQPSRDWAPCCPSCGTLDGLDWRVPPALAALSAPAEAPPSLLAGAGAE